MSTRITINEARVNQVYNNIMDEIYLLFHNHPLSFPTGPMSEAELVEMNYYQAMGRSALQSLEVQAKAARDSGNIGALQSVGQQAKAQARQISPKFAHLPKSSRTR